MPKRAIEQLTPDQFAEWMAEDVEARRQGGPNLQDKYLRLVEQLPEEVRQEYLALTNEVWANVENVAAPKSMYRRYATNDLRMVGSASSVYSTYG